MLVLVTGAGGRIGAPVSTTLTAAGHDVRALVRPADAPGVPEAVDDVVLGDITDSGLVAGALDGVDAVVHLAAVASPRGEPIELLTNNSIGTFCVLDLAGRAGVRRLITASSISALGMAWAEELRSPDYLPLDEEHPLRPEECYGLSKQVDECSAAMVARRYGATVLAYRFPFTAGADDVAGRATAVNEDPATAAKELWAYLDVRDAAAAVLAGVERPIEGYHALHVVAPDTLSLLATEELVERFHPTATRRRPIVGRETLFTRQRARALLGFRAEHLVHGGSEPA